MAPGLSAALGRIGLVGRDSSGANNSRYPTWTEQPVYLQRFFLQRGKMRGLKLALRTAPLRC